MAPSNLAHIFIPTLDKVFTGDAFRKGSGNGVAAIEFDVVVSEAHDAEVEVTEHPVEQGADITDHARVKAVTLTIEGIVSNTPLADSLRLENGQPKEFPWQAPGRAQDIYLQLRDLKDARQLVTVATQRGTYTNMVITRLNVPVTPQTGEALRFTITFKQVRLVKTETAKIKVTETPQHVSLGKQAPTVTEEPRAKSAAASMEDIGRKFLGFKPAVPAP
jgi:hypothetical protein